MPLRQVTYSLLAETANDLAAQPYSVSRPEIPGLDSGLSKPKPKKEKKQKLSTPVELPKLDDTEFVPPPIILKRCNHNSYLCT